MKRKWMTWLLAGTMSISAMAVPAGSTAEALSLVYMARMIGVTPDNLTMNVGDTQAITPKWIYDQSYGKMPELVYQCRDNGIVWVDGDTNGATVVAENAGVTEIKVISANSLDQTQYVTVKVLPEDLADCTASGELLEEFDGVTCQGKQALISVGFDKQEWAEIAVSEDKAEWKFVGDAANAARKTGVKTDGETPIAYCLLDTKDAGELHVKLNLEAKKYGVTTLCFNFMVDNQGNITFENNDAFNFSEMIPTETTLEGDVNGDNKFSIADIAAMHKWLVGAKDKLENQKMGDMNGDGKVNVFDLTIMKRKYINMIPNFVHAKDWAAMYKAEATPAKQPDDKFNQSQMDFAIAMLKESVQQNEEADTNTLISPYSAVQALAMTANGANGETLKQMQQVLGGGMSIDDLNQYLHYMRVNQPNEKTCKLLTANSIWKNNERADIAFKEHFLKTDKDYYNASVYDVPFSQPQTITDINNWVNNHTDGMIPKLVEKDSFTKDSIMALINAVTFDAKWLVPYENLGTPYMREFYAYDDSVQEVPVMYGKEYTYLDDGKATGFLKYYEGRRYAFMAMLPNEDVDIIDYVAQLSPETMLETLKNRDERSIVETMMPKFKVDYSITLNGVLQNMGMADAFDRDNADFSGIADTINPIYISKVLQKTHIDVDEEGTKAAAATAVIMDSVTALPPDRVKQVTLERPFVYGIVDTETNQPIFMGVMMHIDQ